MKTVIHKLLVHFGGGSDNMTQESKNTALVITIIMFIILALTSFNKKDK